MEQLFEIPDDEEVVVFTDEMMKYKKTELIRYIIVLQQNYITLSNEKGEKN